MKAKERHDFAPSTKKKNLLNQLNRVSNHQYWLFQGEELSIVKN